MLQVKTFLKQQAFKEKWEDFYTVLPTSAMHLLKKSMSDDTDKVVPLYCWILEVPSVWVLQKL